MLAGLVVDGEFELVGLVDLDAVVFRLPPVVPRRSRPGDEVILDLDSDERFGAPREPAGGGVVDVLYGDDSDRKLTGEGLAQIRHVNRVI